MGGQFQFKSGRVADEEEVAGKVLGKLGVGLKIYHDISAPGLEEVKKALNPIRATEALLGEVRVVDRRQGTEHMFPRRDFSMEQGTACCT